MQAVFTRLSGEARTSQHLMQHPLGVPNCLLDCRACSARPRQGNLLPAARCAAPARSAAPWPSEPAPVGQSADSLSCAPRPAPSAKLTKRACSRWCKASKPAPAVRSCTCTRCCRALRTATRTGAPDANCALWVEHGCRPREHSHPRRGAFPSFGSLHALACWHVLDTGLAGEWRAAAHARASGLPGDARVAQRRLPCPNRALQS